MNQPDRLALSTADLDQSNPLMPMLARQQEAFLRDGAPTYQQRLDKLRRLRESSDFQELESLASDPGILIFQRLD